MPRIKEAQTNIRTITTVGQKSLSVTIPTSIVRTLGLSAHQKVIVRREGERILIEKWEE